MNYIDLHMHSTCSDGSYTPSELVSYAKLKGLSVIALTDHDTIAGIEEAKNAASIEGIRMVNGVEINSYECIGERRVNLHVLGYFFDPFILEPYMEELKRLRQAHNDAMNEALHRLGIEIEYERMKQQAKERTLTRLNFATALVQGGYADSVEDALVKYLHKGGAAYVEYNFPPFYVTAQRIHEAGGVVSLAHPGQYRMSEDETEKLIQRLTGLGVDAIECIHPSQDTAASERLQHLAKHYGLACSGGSDYHGDNSDGVCLGEGRDGMRIPEWFLDDLKAKKPSDVGLT